MNQRKRSILALKWLVRPAILLVIIAILWHYFAGLRISLVADRLRGIGPFAFLILLPFGLVFLAESYAWRFTMRAARLPGIARIFLVRVATDALLYSIPGGVAIAEPLRPVLLRRECGVDLTEGIGSCIITKINIALAQAVYILIGFSLVVIFYPGLASQFGPGDGIRGFILAAVAFLLVVALLTLPFSGRRIERAFRLLARIPFRPLRTLLAHGEPYILKLDEHVGGFVRDHAWKFCLSLGSSFLAWMFVALETFIILKLLGVEPTVTQAVALESTASLFRIAFFFLPGGIGASEVGFVALLVAFGFPDPVTLSAAYIAVKRLKEAVWILAGYAAFWWIGYNPFIGREAV